MRTKAQVLCLVLYVIGAVPSAWAAAPDCGVENLGGNVGLASYCVQKPAPGTPDSGQVIYYLHGLGGNAMEAYNNGLTSEATHSTIIAVSFGLVWFFAPLSSGAPGSATMQAFVGEMIPRTEARAGVSVESSKRFVVGASMGGFNGTQLLEQHPELFGRIALLCPGLTLDSPYANPAEVASYIQRTGADPVTVARAIVVGRIEFPTPQIWDASTPFNPNNLDAVGAQSPPIFVSIGRQDEWGFYEGTQAFVTQALDRGASVEWNPVDGPHCSFDQQALQGFLGGG